MIRFPKPRDDVLGAGIYLPHGTNLLTSFLAIVLINAYCIGPDSQVTLFPQGVQCIVEIATDFVFDMVEKDRELII
jgi:F0F1-type ATP synthase membrane subunit a